MPDPVNEYHPGEADTRPWGRWEVLAAAPGYAVKRITVLPGGILSLQRHRHRAEHWIIVAGSGRITRDAEIFDRMAGEAVEIPRGAVHRIANPGGETLVFIEVQIGAILAESDIERLEDSYGRS